MFALKKSYTIRSKKNYRMQTLLHNGYEIVSRKLEQVHNNTILPEAQYLPFFLDHNTGSKIAVLGIIAESPYPSMLKARGINFRLASGNNQYVIHMHIINVHIKFSCTRDISLE